MFSMTVAIGVVQVQIDTDETLSFDAIDSLINRGAATALTLFDEHLGSMIKYENYDNDVDCEVCEAVGELDS